MVIRPDVTPLATQLPSLSLEGTSAPSPAPGFGDRVRDLVLDVNHSQVRAEQLSADYANGAQNDLHGTMIAVEQADITLRFAANIRNRVIEAYREVMRMGG